MNRLPRAATKPARVSLAVVLAASLAQPGCTAIGYFIGRHADNKKPMKAKPVDKGAVETLNAGELIEVVLWDGREITGRYRGLQWAKPEEYAERYKAASQALGPEAPPALGPGARLVVTSGSQAVGAYLGIGPGFVRFQEPGFPSPTAVQLHRIVTLADASGRSVSGERLRTLLAERKLPTLAALAIEQPQRDTVVQHADVATINRLERPHSGQTTGMILGLVADVAVVAGFVAAMNSGWESSDDSWGDSGSTSCPLFESFDGKEWWLDAEPLGGAFYEAAERTDLARLDRLAQVDGEFRLRMRNDQQEIDHVDALALWVIDHPRGAEVVPDAAGRLYLVRSASAPLAGRILPTSAVERRDPDVARLVAAADGERFVSDLWGRSASAPDQLRDGFELEYAVPAGASSAVLVTRAGATAYGARMLRAALELQGRDLGLFYARLGQDAAARAAFEDARAREALPTVRVWDAGGWRVAGHLRDLPSLVRRDQAVPIDLGPGQGDRLRLRIDGPPGLWAVDRAVVSFDASSAPAGTRVPLARATAEDGSDRLGLLLRADGRRHSLRPRQDTVELRFRAPQRRRGLERSVFLEATGYYNVIVPADGEPQREAFRRLVAEPGAVARFMLARVRDGAPPS